jgi:cbb3-type cytochrome oxidase subunit 3
VFVLGVAAAYKYWQKKKREQDQARFLKLFEDGDDIEDELGLGTVL